MADIIPAIIPKDIRDLEDHISNVVGHVRSVQIDVLDGKLTTLKSWPYIPLGNEDFSRIIREEEGLPFWEEIEFEIDLMIEDPNPVLEQWVAAGASRLVVHAESFKTNDDLHNSIREFKNRFSLAGSALSVQIGIAINLDSNVSEYESSLRDADFFQCMGIKHIGVQGNPFDERAYERIREVRSLYPHIPISVDGGVSSENAHALIQAGVNRLVIGSAIFRSENIPATIEEFRSL